MTKTHTEHKFEHDMMKLKESIITMGETAERMIGHAMCPLHRGKSVSAQEMADLEKKTNELEMTIDAMCIEIIARYQPTASDLRLIIVGLKISKDLERIGDMAINIAEKLKAVIDLEHSCAYDDLMRMAEQAAGMIHDTLDAFVKKNVHLANEVCARDDEIDGLNTRIRDELIHNVQKTPSTAAQSAALILVAHNLERIADHATNIAEETVYFVKGQDMRHSGFHE